MKPRTHAEVASFLRQGLLPFEGKVITRQQLTEHLTKELKKLLPAPRRPLFEIKVVNVDEDGRIQLHVDLRDFELADKLVDALGKECEHCYGEGLVSRAKDDVALEDCSVCEGVGRIPF